MGFTVKKLRSLVQAVVSSPAPSVPRLSPTTTTEGTSTSVTRKTCIFCSTSLVPDDDGGFGRSCLSVNDEPLRKLLMRTIFTQDFLLKMSQHKDFNFQESLSSCCAFCIVQLESVNDVVKTIETLNRKLSTIVEGLQSVILKRMTNASVGHGGRKGPAAESRSNERGQAAASDDMITAEEVEVPEEDLLGLEIETKQELEDLEETELFYDPSDLVTTKDSDSDEDGEDLDYGQMMAGDNHDPLASGDSDIVTTNDAKEAPKTATERRQRRASGTAKAKTFECPICKRILHRKWTYNKHLLIHSGAQNLCPKCGKGFTYAHTLRAHLLAICKVGSKDQIAKAVEYERVRHIAYQKKMKVQHYPCDLCQKRYLNPENLVTHRLKVHGITAEEEAGTQEETPTS